MSTHQVDRLAEILFSEYRTIQGRSPFPWKSLEEYEREKWRRLAVAALRFAHGVEVKEERKAQ